MNVTKSVSQDEIARHLPNIRRHYRLAARKNETYFWYPEAGTQEDILKIREELLKKHDSVTFYNIHNEWTREDFRNWKDSLINRTKVFRDECFRFDILNIKELSPEGYIVLVRN